jgi:hypothetical protein
MFKCVFAFSLYVYFIPHLFRYVKLISCLHVRRVDPAYTVAMSPKMITYINVILTHNAGTEPVPRTLYHIEGQLICFLLGHVFS